MWTDARRRRGDSDDRGFDPMASQEPMTLRSRAERHARWIMLVVTTCLWVWLAATTVQRFVFNLEFEKRRQAEANMVIFRVCEDAAGLDLARDFVKCEEAKIASLSRTLWLDALRTTASDTFQAVVILANQEVTRTVQTFGILSIFFCALAVMLYLLVSSLFATSSQHGGANASDFEQAMLRVASAVRNNDAAPYKKNI